MKKIYISLITFIGSMVAHSQVVAIPDSNFKASLISQGLDKNKNGEIERGEIYSLIKLDVSNKNIKDLTGIEAFTELFQLNCSNNSLTSINLSKNYLLTIIDVSVNQLSKLDLSKVPMASNINCNDNLIDTLDLSKNTSATILYCRNNKLTHLDVSFLNLYQFDCSVNKLTSLDLSKSTSLYSLSCSSNLLTGTLNLSNSTDLAQLNAKGNVGLGYICVKDVAVASANSNYLKDATTLLTEDCNIITSLTESNSSKNMVLSPNPSNTTFYLDLATPSHVAISNLDGKIMNDFIDVGRISFGENYLPGVYVVLVKNAEHQTAIRILKQ